MKKFVLILILISTSILYAQEHYPYFVDMETGSQLYEFQTELRNNDFYLLDIAEHVMDSNLGPCNFIKIIYANCDLIVTIRQQGWLKIVEIWFRRSGSYDHRLNVGADWFLDNKGF